MCERGRGREGIGVSQPLQKMLRGPALLLLPKLLEQILQHFQVHCCGGDHLQYHQSESEKTKGVRAARAWSLLLGEQAETILAHRSAMRILAS